MGEGDYTKAFVPLLSNKCGGLRLHFVLFIPPNQLPRRLQKSESIFSIFGNSGSLFSKNPKFLTTKDGIG